VRFIAATPASFISLQDKFVQKKAKIFPTDRKNQQMKSFYQLGCFYLLGTFFKNFLITVYSRCAEILSPKQQESGGSS
jgi:hypothetical protein